MKISKEKTDWVILKAHNNSDWFCSEYAIVNIKSIKEEVETVVNTNIFSELNYVNIRVGGGDFQFFNFDADADPECIQHIEYDITEENKWFYIDIENEDDFLLLQKLEYDYGSLTISMWAGNQVYLYSYLKYGSEELYVDYPYQEIH